MEEIPPIKGPAGSDIIEYMAQILKRKFEQGAPPVLWQNDVFKVPQFEEKGDVKF